MIKNKRSIRLTLIFVFNDNDFKLMFQKLIEANKIASEIQEADIQAFILKNQKKYDAEFLKLIAEQFISRQKTKTKLPSWFQNQEVVLPPPLSVEQASSELTGQYKAALLPTHSKKGYDLTGGMGIDCSFFAKHSQSVVYIEQNPILVERAQYNFEKLGIKNVECKNQDSVQFINETSEKVDWIYADPARRDSSQNKVFLIDDCEPNILKINDLLLEKAEQIIIKYSPLLDIKLAVSQLQSVDSVHVIAVDNEVKELLFILKKSSNQKPTIHCVNLSFSKEKQTFDFNYEEESEINLSYAKPKTYIYEPNGAILKAGAFKSVTKAFDLQKLASNSHLYTSDAIITQFAGRSFRCLGTSKLDKKEILRYLPNLQANISVRNFPMKPEEIKKKLGIKDGGDKYLFATELSDKSKIILICEKVA